VPLSVPACPCWSQPPLLSAPKFLFVCLYVPKIIKFYKRIQLLETKMKGGVVPPTYPIRFDLERLNLGMGEFLNFLWG